MQKYHSAKVVKFPANQQCYTSHALSGISAREGIGQGDQPTHLPDLSGEDRATSEIGLRYFIFNTASVLGDKIATRLK